jgi:DNA-binding transcriptional regulator YiaG
MDRFKVKGARKFLKMTQAQFAEALGVKRITVQMWEGGTRNPTKTAELLLDRIIKESS